MPAKIVDSDFLESLASRLSSMLPPGVSDARKELESNFKSVLQSALSKLDLVSRSEFDVQAGVLARTREKLEALEARLVDIQAALEAQQSSQRK